MDRTLIAVFDSREHANQAREDLLALGVPAASIHLRQGTTADIPHASGDQPASTTDGDSGKRVGFFARLFGLDDDDDVSGEYAEAERRGSTVLAVDPLPEERVADASEIMSRHGAIDMDERVTGWRERGWSGYDAKAEPMSQEDMTRERELASRPPAGEPRTVAEGDTMRIPVVEERLDVGKRVVQGGGVRVFTRVAERPIEEQVTLREEHARIERHPVDREATEAELGNAFREGSVELRETEEQAVVAKTPRVVEEVSIDREASERTETIRDTVRRTEVEVEDLPASRQSRSDSARPPERP
jgi:uncharacterized protein (TIGR02271 family)